MDVRSSLTVQVLIVGGGPVGLSMAIGLRHFGVDCLLVEQHPTTLDFPKGRAVNARTMEIFRRWGIEDRVAARALPHEETSRAYLGETLLSREFVHLTRVDPAMSWVSPSVRVACSQQLLETVLHEVAVERGADIRFAHRLVSFEQHPHEVQAIVRRDLDGHELAISAQYIVAADGSRGTTREHLGIGIEGPGAIGNSVSILVEAPLGDRIADRASLLYGVRQPRVGGGFAVVDNDRQWLLMLPRDPDTEPPEWFTEERCLTLVREAIGDPGVPVRYLAHRLWQPTARWATSMSAGRVFLAGDAAHVTTPAGGLGMNGGIADIHNLAWKLSGVLKGWAPGSLLATYDQERRPMARRAAEASLYIGQNMRDPDARVGGLGVSLGAIYESDVIVADGTAATEVDDPVHDYVPAARPGHRAPHVRTATGESVLDHFGANFVVLADASHSHPADLATVTFDVPVDLVTMPGSQWRDVYGINLDGLVLVRPDGVVSFRTESCTNPAAAIHTALARSVGH